ncbi:hypothetical protein [Ideonella sp.]|uniref:hypothetical protein n=1 Tax=Ideonella sp. TaxID=1929293 RepID=UPI0035AE7075
MSFFTLPAIKAAARITAIASVCVWAAGSASAQSETSLWNGSTEPVALYGHCGVNSSMGSKLDALQYVGEGVLDVLAIKVLRCDHFTGGGGFHKLACPSGSPYDYCMESTNDGMGNWVEFGVLKLNVHTDPNALYEGCPTGADLQPKLGLIRPAGKDPRTISALVTVACTAATAAKVAAPKAVDCPKGKHPYSYCVSTPNDGHGNAVMLGALHYKGSSDPNGLYGECDQLVQPGFTSKASVLPLVGKSMQNVRSIDLLSCAIPWGHGGDFPKELHVGACVNNKWVNPAVAGRYDYCIWGTDARNAGIVLGISGH